jgi:plastocyanin
MTARERGINHMSRLLPAGTILVVLAIAGCGGSSKSSTTAASTTAAASSASSSSSAPASGGGGSGGALSLAADPSGALKFDKTSLSASAGKVTIDFTNKAALGHNVTIASSAGAVAGATPTFSGGSKTLTVNLKPGKYTFFCSVPGHEQAGMKGTLVVK